MGRVHQFDNRTGVTYIYDTQSIFDSSTGKNKTKRTLIGKLDPDTKEIIPTGRRGRPEKAKTANDPKDDKDRKIFLAALQRKDEAIALLKEENRRLLADKSRLEKLIYTVMNLCSDSIRNNDLETDETPDTDL